MKNYQSFLAATLCLLFAVVITFAQTPQKIEQELVKNITEVQKYSNYGSNYDSDKLSSAGEVFEKNLLRFTKNPSTLTYNFPALSQSMQIATSENGNLRIYSWDSESGGTMHDYYRVYQYRGADGKVYSRTEIESDEEGGAGSFVHDIFTVKSKDTNIYIACSTFIGSTNDHYQSAKLLKINGAELVDKVKLIKTNSGLTDSLSFEYNFFSVVDRKERPVKLILFDKKLNILKIPVVIETKKFPNGEVTDKFINYKFNGTYFIKVS